MTKQEEKESTLISTLDLSVRTKNVLEALEVKTVKDLHTMYVLDTIPKVGTVVRWIPLARYMLTYSKLVNEEVKDILLDYCDIDDVKHVGVR